MNELKMELQQSILTLSGRGWSQRRIARELGINRETVGKYCLEAGAADPPKPAIVPAGSSEEVGSKPAILPTGSKAGRKSQCEPFREQIMLRVEAGLSAQRVYQDLVSDYQFSGNYDAVKRFVRGLGQTNELPFRRM